MNKLIFILASSKAAQYGLYNAQNYIKYENFMMFPINTIKWWIIKFVYGIANFASTLLTHVVGVGSFVTDSLGGKGELGSWITSARNAAMTIAAAYLIWVGVRFVVSKQPPQFKNVVLQLFVSIFLILSLSDITTTLVNYSTSWYNDFTQTDTKNNANKANKDVSDLPFQMLASSTNDVEYLIKNQFDGTNAPAKKKVNISTSGIQKTVPEVQYGFNDLTKTEVNEGTVPLDQVIQWPDVDGGGGGSQKGYLNSLDDTTKGKGKDQKFKFGWLIYEMKSYKDKKGATQVSAPDIPRVGTTIFSFGGYPRFQVDFFPLVIVLCALIIAYAFASYAIIKSFLELGLMNVLGIFLFAVDIDSGNKTKQVIQAVFSTSLLVALQGLEIAFYKIVMLWGMNAKDAGTFGSGVTRAWVFVVYALVATTILITGSQRVTDFFGVDTGAQHGWRSAGSVMYAAKQLGKGAKRAVTAPTRAFGAAKATRDNIGHTFNTQGSIKRDAKQQAKEGTRQAAINQMAGVDKFGNPTSTSTANDEEQPFTPKQAEQGSNFAQGAALGSGVTKVADMVENRDKPGNDNPEIDNQPQQSMQTPRQKVRSQIKPTPSAVKASTKALNKAAKASQSAIARQAKRNAIADNMRAAAHNAKRIANGKKPDAPLRSLNTNMGKVDQLAKPYSSNDPKGEGLISNNSGLKKALGTDVEPSAKTKELAQNYQQDKAAYIDSVESHAPAEEQHMLRDNMANSRKALDQSIDEDRQRAAYLNSTQPQKVNELPSGDSTRTSGQTLKPNVENISRNQKKIGSSNYSAERQQKLSGLKSKPQTRVAKISQINSGKNVSSISPKQLGEVSMPKPTNTIRTKGTTKVNRIGDSHLPPKSTTKPLNSSRIGVNKPSNTSHVSRGTAPLNAPRVGKESRPPKPLNSPRIGGDNKPPKSDLK